MTLSHCPVRKGPQSTRPAVRIFCKQAQLDLARWGLFSLEDDTVQQGVELPT